jgi:glycosyltransferase involved in cell wall biosynthesis
LDEECSERDIADALSDLILNPQKLREMSVANIEWAEKNTWENRGDLIQQVLTSNTRGDQ